MASLVASWALVASPAHACKGSTELFNIDFNEDEALGEGDHLQYGNGKLLVKVPKGKIGWAIYPESISETDMDLCVTFKVLKELDQNSAAALVFWGDSEVGDRYLAFVFTKTGNAQISQLGKSWKTLAEGKKPDYKKGQENTIRVTLKGTEGVAYVNDKQFAKFKRKQALDESNVGIAFQGGDWEVTKFVGTSVD